MKIGQRVRDNFDLYQRCFETFWTGGTTRPALPEVPVDDPREPSSALEAFAALDSCGERLPCFEPDLLAEVMAGKGDLNLNIRMWAEGVRNGLFTIDEFSHDLTWLPKWVWKAVENQARKTK